MRTVDLILALIVLSVFSVLSSLHARELQRLEIEKYRIDVQCPVTK